MNIISLFAGVGGIDIGFHQAGDFYTVYANEFDRHAQHTFTTNFPNTLLDCSDIRDVNVQDIPDADVLLAGFPCQPFSIAGYRKGLEDKRGDLFFEVLRVIKSKQPQVIFLENVKNLVTHDHGNTFKVIREFLVHAGYHIKWKVLNARLYGNIPQNRERIYIVGFKDRASYDDFHFPAEVALNHPLTDYIDFDDNSFKEEHPDDFNRFYYRDGVQPFYQQLVNCMTRHDTIYQWRRQYVRENMNGVVPTLTANMGTGGHNVPLILTSQNRIRKLTPSETFKVQGFPINPGDDPNLTYTLPSDIAISHLYKQAGNSVVVPVIKRIAEQIVHSLHIQNKNLPLPDIHNRACLLRTAMNGRMEGQSVPIKFFNTDTELKKYIVSNSNLPHLPIFNNDDFYNAINHNGNHDFFTVLTTD